MSVCGEWPGSIRLSRETEGRILLALVWTQYQYVLFPAAVLSFSLRVLLHHQVPDPDLERLYGG